VKDANAHARELGELQAHVLSEKLFSLQIRRTKEEVLKDELPMKDERVVFCEPSELQKQIYRHILKQPDFVLLSQANAPCECGVNQKFFLEYQHLASLEERIEYQRRNKDSVITRRQCCHKTPTIPGEGIDPRAVLWRQHEEHSEDLVECMRCPYCISFNALHILYKCSSHVGLLQLEKMPEHYPVGSKARKEAHKALARAKVFLPPEILHQLPGGSYIRESSIMNDHFSLSGKMIVVNKLLKAIKLQQGRVLLFAESTQSLDLIENFIKSEGYDHLRMDGTTTTTRREELVQEFANSNTFLFLLSTKAMGLGLNLTQANFVIIWDVSWNPSSDAQAQDRAFRIGQKRDVKVFRLVSRGTIEELKYLRQVYKTQLTQETIVDPNDGDREKSARLFRGVAGDKDRKGELFGFANLFKFKVCEGCFKVVYYIDLDNTCLVSTPLS
jgi:SNF2 family DNA or RNA helicase